MNTDGEIVVLTGSSGCLGFETLKQLVARDERVLEIRCLDIVQPSELMKRAVEEEVERFKEAAPLSNGCKRPGKIVKYIKGDIRDINVVEKALNNADCVIHCAAKVDIWTEPSKQDGAELESINVQGTELLLSTCVRLGVPKFVHVSSFETFVSHHTIYYATESTIPDPKYLLFGASAETKKEAENKVRQYSRKRLIKREASACSSAPGCANNESKSKQQQLEEYQKLAPKDSLSAVIIRFTQIYGPNDKYFVSKLLRLAKFFSGRLQRFSNVWIRQQPIYVGNAAWSLIKAKQQMDTDESISGEEFHITDDTTIGDPFDFIEPFLECKGMKLSKATLPAWPVWLLISLFSMLRAFFESLDILGLFTAKRSLLDKAIERDNEELERQQQLEREQLRSEDDAHLDTKNQNFSISARDRNPTTLRWYHMITSQTFYFMCNSLFLNRTKASLRLNYEPLFSAEESISLSIDWYKNHLHL